MIFGSENISKYSQTNIAIWMILAFQAGIINMGGLIAFQVVVSHVTGYFTFASLEAGTGHQLQSFGLMIMLVAFLLGAIFSGVLVDLQLKLKKKPKYYTVFGALSVLTLITAILGGDSSFVQFGNPVSGFNSYFLVFLLCFACGLQNGAVTLVSNSIVRTTHLTGITTDLGIGLVRVWNRKRIQGIENERLANYMRMGVIVCFSLGAFMGVGLFKNYEFKGFYIPALISGLLFLAAFHSQVIRSR